MNDPENTEQPAHLLLRPAAVSAGRDLIDLHNEIAIRNGQMVFGKLGTPPGRRVIERLQQQLTGHVDTRLMLALKHAGKFVGFSSQIQSMFERKLPNKFRHLQPTYYQVRNLSIQFWLLLSGRFESCDLEDLRLATSSRKLVDVLSESRASTMLVTAKSVLTKS